VGQQLGPLKCVNHFPHQNSMVSIVSSVFPEAIIPTNVDLGVANIAERIPFPGNTFDYIHQRLLIAGLTNEDWENVSSTLNCHQEHVH
jgi:hypothetical protein